MPNTSERILDKLLLDYYSRRSGPPPVPAPAPQPRVSATPQAPQAPTRPRPPSIQPSLMSPVESLKARARSFTNATEAGRDVIRNTPVSYDVGALQIPEVLSRGMFDPDTGRAYVSGPNEEYAGSVAIHELTHAMQERLRGMGRWPLEPGLGLNDRFMAERERVSGGPLMAANRDWNESREGYVPSELTTALELQARDVQHGGSTLPQQYLDNYLPGMMTSTAGRDAAGSWQMYPSPGQDQYMYDTLSMMYEEEKRRAFENLLRRYPDLRAELLWGAWRTRNQLPTQQASG